MYSQSCEFYNQVFEELKLVFEELKLAVTYQAKLWKSFRWGEQPSAVCTMGSRLVSNQVLVDVQSNLWDLATKCFEVLQLAINYLAKLWKFFRWATK